MKTVLFWFRNDLRLHDQPALAHATALAAQQGAALLPVFCHAPSATTRWGFERTGPHRRAFVASTLACLSTQLAARGSRMLECHGLAEAVLPALAKALGADGDCSIVCEAIAAPEEEAEVAALRASGLQVHTVWQSSLLHPDDLPFDPAHLPPVFTAFRNAVERAKVQPRAPLPTPAALAALPPAPLWMDGQFQPPAAQASAAHDGRSSFPHATAAFAGGEVAALAHLAQYLERKLPHSYKQTRNGLTGVDYSSKFSPWLATGALSARQAMAQLRQFEAEHGASDGSYWLWFELLWRDYFRLLHLQHIAGRGTDPRGGRRFNPQKQAQDHDADGHYRRLWGSA